MPELICGDVVMPVVASREGLDYSAHGHSILVSRDPQVVRVFSRILNDMNISVELCTDIQCVIERVEGEKFDAIIVDADEGCNAWGLLVGMRQSRRNRRSIGVALVSNQEGFRTAFDMGANLVMSKPLQGERAARNLSAAHAVILREMRRSVRYPVDIPAFAETGTTKTHATITDIGEGGAGLRTRSALTQGENLQLRFDLPDTETIFEAGVEVVWTDAEGRAGIRFLQVRLPARRALQRWLDIKSEQHEQARLKEAKGSSLPPKRILAKAALS